VYVYSKIILSFINFYIFSRGCFARVFPLINQRSNSNGRARKPVDSQTRPMLIGRFRVRCRAPPSDPLKSIRSYAYISASPSVAASPTTCCCASLWLIPCLSTHISLFLSLPLLTISLFLGLSLSLHFYFSFYPINPYLTATSTLPRTRRHCIIGFYCHFSSLRT